MKKVIGYIDIEPRWVDIAPHFIEVLENKHADASQKKIARDEIMKMAKVSDEVRQTQKRCERQKKKFILDCK
jgi:hypothetical protein